MSIRIDKLKCVSCGKCADICPGNLIYKNTEGKYFIKYPKDCWGCAACLKECPAQAVYLYLGEDIGGEGGYLCTSKEENTLNWHIIDKNGQEHIIKINRKESNQY